MTEFNFDVLVIGSGPAGNTAAIYLARNSLKIAVVSGMSIGGQLTTTTEIENFPGFPSPILGTDLMERMMNQSRNLGVEMVYDQLLSVDFSKRPFRCVMDGGDTYIANYVVIATGASPRWLGLPSEEEFKGRGVSSCAICDGSFYKGMSVAVVGGGNTAGTEALHLSHLCKKVYVIHRREQCRINERILGNLKERENVEFVLNSIVTEIVGTEVPKAVNGIRVVNQLNNVQSVIPVSGVFVAIGKIPATSVFKDTDLKLDDGGYIITKGDSGQTSIDYVYAVGDVTNKQFKQGVIAAGYGAIAALEIQNDIMGK